MAFSNTGTLSVQDAAARLGFSTRHVRRLIEAGELGASQSSGEASCMVSIGSVAAFEQRRSAAERRADEFSRSLDDAGAPSE